MVKLNIRTWHYRISAGGEYGKGPWMVGLDLHDQQMSDLSNADREHIGQCIMDGCTSGEIVKSDYPDWDSAEVDDGRTKRKGKRV